MLSAVTPTIIAVWPLAWKGSTDTDLALTFPSELALCSATVCAVASSICPGACPVTPFLRRTARVRDRPFRHAGPQAAALSSAHGKREATAGACGSLRGLPPDTPGMLGTVISTGGARWPITGDCGAIHDGRETHGYELGRSAIHNERGSGDPDRCRPRPLRIATANQGRGNCGPGNHYRRNPRLGRGRALRAEWPDRDSTGPARSAAGCASPPRVRHSGAYRMSRLS